MNEQWIVSFPDGAEIPFHSERDARSFSVRYGANPPTGCSRTFDERVKPRPENNHHEGNMTLQEHTEMEKEAVGWAAIGGQEAMDCADRIRQSITADRMDIWDRTGVRPWDPIGSRATEQ